MFAKLELMEHQVSWEGFRMMLLFQESMSRIYRGWLEVPIKQLQHRIVPKYGSSESLRIVLLFQESMSQRVWVMYWNDLPLNEHMIIRHVKCKWHMISLNYKFMGIGGATGERDLRTSTANFDYTLY